MFIQHVTIYTADVEASVKFYQDVAGLTIEDDRRPHAPIVFLANRKGETCIELIGVPVGEAYSGCGLTIGFYTENVEAEHERLTAMGLNPTDFMCPGPNVKFFFVKDPSGVTVQLIRE